MSSNPSPDNLQSELTSTLQVGLLIALAIICAVASTTALWKTGCYIGRPLGDMLIRIAPPVPDLSEEQRSIHQRRVAGAIAVFLCVIAVAIEFVKAENARIRAGRPGLSWQRLVLVYVKGCFEGMIADAVLALAVKMFGLA